MLLPHVPAILSVGDARTPTPVATLVVCLEVVVGSRLIGSLSGGLEAILHVVLAASVLSAMFCFAFFFF